MKRQILIACILVAGLAGCETVQQVVQPVTAPVRNTDGPITLSGTPTLSAPAPIRQDAPKAQNWRRDLPRNIAYFNMGDASVAIYDSADRSNQTGKLLPGEGGFIQTCDDAKPVCKMNFGSGRSGWVSMNSMAGVSS
ncbi:hypothetical protein [Sagittula sp. S175]|uniref:hypothetical protein n=1 Tax=Sagittula sp. S175 TaxID=3415129 RepID=UPI003C7D8601